MLEPVVRQKKVIMVVYMEATHLTEATRRAERREREWGETETGDREGRLRDRREREIERNRGEGNGAGRRETTSFSRRTLSDLHPIVS